MDKLLYIAMNGASETMKAQAVNSQNLANANTTGFRADLESYASQPVYGPGHASRVYGLATGKGVDFSPGSVIGTGRDLDISINGKGWIAVQGPDGNEAYTRAGNLQVDSLGLLRTGAGHPVIGSGSPIAIPPFEQIEIGTDGTISILPVGQGATALQVVDRIKLVNPPEGDMVKGSDSLMHLANFQPAIADSTITVQAGTLESSNVNAIESMVSLIQLARHYEMQIKTMANAEENDKAAASLMRIG